MVVMSKIMLNFAVRLRIRARTRQIEDPPPPFRGRKTLDARR